MKAVILAGGLGTRLSEETEFRPKPMVSIGGMPIIWHIMKIYYTSGIKDFVVCLGYKGYLIKEFFANYYLHSSDVTVNLATGSLNFHANQAERWKVTLLDTGEDTLTGGRLRRVREHLDDDEPFCLSYGDGVADIDIGAQLAFHQQHGKLATVTAVRPPGRFGVLSMDGQNVLAFEEKGTGESDWINGGFFVLSPKVIDLIDGDSTIWERQPLETLARQGELQAYRHHGFWMCMDTLRDKRNLDEIWAKGNPPWKIW